MFCIKKSKSPDPDGAFVRVWRLIHINSVEGARKAKECVFEGYELNESLVVFRYVTKKKTRDRERDNVAIKNKPAIIDNL